MGDFDVDATLEAIESPSGDSNIPMSTPVPQEAAPTPAQEIEFQWRDRQIKAPLDKARQWMSQGYDYGQRVSELKAEREAFLAEQQGHKQKYSRYEEVDAYAKQDPAWWQHVEETWQQRQARQQGQADPNDPVSQIASELEDLKKFKQEIISERQQKVMQESDSKLNEEITSIQKQHADLDWTAVDDTGLTLEMRVLRHAQQNGINSFRAAFRDMNHEHLVQIAASKAREDAVKQRQIDAKKGLLGKSPTPIKGIQNAQNVKGKSYSDLLSEAKAELGIS